MCATIFDERVKQISAIKEEALEVHNKYWPDVERRLLKRHRNQAEIDWRKSYHLSRIIKHRYNDILFQLLDEVITDILPKKIEEQYFSFVDISDIPCAAICGNNDIFLFKS